MLGGLYILKMKSDHLLRLLELCLRQELSPFANKLHLTAKRAPDFWARLPAMTYVNTPVLRLAPQFVILTGTLDPLQGVWPRRGPWTPDSFFFLFCFLAAQQQNVFSFALLPPWHVTSLQLQSNVPIADRNFQNCPPGYMLFSLRVDPLRYFSQWHQTDWHTC